MAVWIILSVFMALKDGHRSPNLLSRKLLLAWIPDHNDGAAFDGPQGP